MTRILLPTRNRPASLLSVIRFLEKFYPGTELIIADGSTEEHGATNARTMRDAGLKVQADYRKYPYDMPFFDRILDVLNGEKDDYFIMGSDDDYPLMDNLDRARDMLDKEDDGATALGATLHMKLHSANHLSARLGLSRPIRMPDPEARARNFAGWAFSTTYAVSRRDLLIERYKRAREVFLPGFYDFGVGLHDALTGKMLALPEVTFIATRNFNHSYLRPDDPLIFVRRSGDFFKLAQYIEGDLQKNAGMAREDAADVASRLLLRQVAVLAGFPAHRARGFESSNLFSNGVVQKQLETFYEIFKSGNAIRETYYDRLRFVVEAMKQVSGSSDNSGEASTVESLDEQMLKSRDAGPDRLEKQKMFKAAQPPQKKSAAVQSLIPGEITIDVDTLTHDEDVQRECIHLLVIGQSNASNHGLGPQSASFGAVTDGEGLLLPLKDPLPGGSGEGGSVWTRTAELIKAQRLSRNFIVTLRAQSGTSISDWSAGGKMYEMLAADLEKIAAFDPPVTHIVWHQGERDTLLKTKQSDYAAGFESLYELVASRLPQAIWIIFRSSFRMGETNASTIRAQNAIIKSKDRCFEGPNTDLLGEKFRYDDTHFNEAGLSEFSRMFVHSLTRCIAAD